MGASWCSPCRELADWFSYGVDDITKKPFWKNEYNNMNSDENEKIPENTKVPKAKPV